MVATEPEYHRILSEPLRSWISDSADYSTPVGLLACQRNPLLRKNTAFVISSTLSAPPPPPKGKQNKKSVIAPTLPTGVPVLEVILSDTVLFPEGGGQPTDTGIFRTQDGSVWPVLKVLRQGGTAVHYVQHVGDQTPEEALQKYFAAGVKIEVELDNGGWERRTDHMTLHTSQHLLSALLDTKLQLPTLSWSLTSSGPCYVEIPRGMTTEEILMIQNEANRLVFEGTKVHIEVQELDRTAIAPVEKTENGRAVGRGLPEDYTGGVHRVVHIAGVDINPCCGTHLPSLNNLQLFILPHTDALSRSATTVARLYFLAGPRLINHLTSTHNSLASTAALLSCGLPQVPERVAQVVDDRKSVTKRSEDLELELAKFIATEISSEMDKTSPGGLFRKHVHRLDDSPSALAFLTAIASALADLAAKSSLKQSYILVLSSSPSSPALTGTNVVLVLGSDDARVKIVGDGLKSTLGVKGGGKGSRWSGKLVGTWKAKEDAVVEEILEKVS
ncbi:tRNA-SAD domain-containing protein [Mycena indigotica]|uniref:tRNA-SAD domain-containing protein n=1 Tax=Mycena indigotica TaxID=2126181 RepID=A0A8H6SMM5_9AGAR|nr:tRNA-SAD domain-containing protein [Mycena indigotica]KAF7301650.1 tRNA-SAD domain-containing protein [Mycena indigotica]